MYLLIAVLYIRIKSLEVSNNISLDRLLDRRLVSMDVYAAEISVKGVRRQFVAALV